MAYASLARPIALALALTACESSPGTTTSAGTDEASTGTDAGTDAATDTGDSTGTTGEPTSTGAAAETTVDLPGVHFKQDIWPILQPNCSCHVVPPDGMTPGVAAYPTFGQDPAGAYLVLVNKPSTIVGLDYVEPGDPAASYLFHKISGTQLEVDGDGDAMPPYPGPMLSAEQIATIKEWIDTGALE
jgi:hypothetical protein